MKLKSKAKPKIWVVDTEDDSHGNLYQIIFYNGSTYIRFTSVADCIKWLDVQNKKTICFAVNLEYDIINIFRGNYARIKWMFGKSRLITARYKKFTFYDTLNHWKMSVAEMGKRIGLPKQKFNPKSIKYCKRDCKVTYDFVISMLKIYDKIGIPLKSTLPASVYAYWLKNYSPFKLPKLNINTLDIYKNAYYGGRNDCYYIGKFKGKVHTVDVNSLYPFVMQSEFPNPYIVEHKYSKNDYGITYCRVQVDQKIPVLPFRTKVGKLIYPNGKFEGYWTNAELNYAESVGNFKILKIYDSFTFPITCFPFNNFVTDFYNRRQKATDELMKMTYKISMNSLYGKFGQGKDRTHVISYYDFVKKNIKLGTDDIYRFDDIVIYNTHDKYPINTNMVWALYTTSYARIYLHMYLQRILKHGGQILYCDTDSIYYHAKNPIIETSDNLGGWKSEGIYTGIEIKLPKMYRLLKHRSNKIKTKGVPKKSQDLYFDNGIVEYDKPIKFKEGLRRGIIPNLWFKHTKQNQLKYDKAYITKTGYTKPFKLDL